MASLRQKEGFYRSVASLLRVGIPLPTALDKLGISGLESTSYTTLQARIRAGHPLGEALAEAASLFTPLETALLTAGERCGRLDQACEGLATHFAALAEGRETLRRKLLYPILLLHFGVLGLALPKLLTEGLPAFAAQVLPFFLAAYTLVLTPFLAWRLFDGLQNPLLQSVCNLLPVIGPILRQFALARFCRTYGLGLGAGLNLFEILRLAGDASGSHRIRTAALDAIEHARGGRPPGPVLAASRTFPTSLMQLWVVGEETGSLDQDLERWSHDAERDAHARFAQAVDLTIKAASAFVALLLGWRIISAYQQIIDGYLELIP